MLQLLTANLLVFPPVSSSHAHFVTLWRLLHWLEAPCSFGIRVGVSAEICCPDFSAFLCAWLKCENRGESVYEEVHSPW